MSNSPAELGEKAARGELTDDEIEQAEVLDVQTQAVCGAMGVVSEAIEAHADATEERTEMVAEYVRALKGAAQVQQSSSDGGGDGETDTSVTSEHDFDGNECVDQVTDWLSSAESFHGDLESEWCDVEFAEIDGTVGVIIDAGNPWEHSQTDDANAPNETWKAHQEALKTVTQGADAIEYHGDPDYFNFLPASDIDEVTG
jgi:hypothetical protein